MIVVVALVATLVVLVFARDVSRAAHGAITARRSENRSFAALANDLLSQENAFDGRLYRLLSQGGSLSRPVFAARLDQLDQELPAFSSAADLLRRPTLAHRVNETLDDLTDQRVAAYESLLYDVARTLSLPWGPAPASPVNDPAAVLVATSRTWARDRFALAKEPGDVALDQTSDVAAGYVAKDGLASLEDSSSLRLVRAVSIAAVRVTPAPLPAAAGVVLLPPVGTVRIGVTVQNASYDEQPVRLTVRVTPLNGRGGASTQTLVTTLGPLAAYAFDVAPLTTAPSERARLVVVVTGARAARGKVVAETFRLEMSPSGST